MTEHWTAWIATDTGSVRVRNEDRCLAGGWVSDGSDGAWSVRLEAERWCAAVADGMGGHRAGALASETAILGLVPLTDKIDGEQAVIAAVDELNERVFDAMLLADGRLGMGCTLVAVSVHADEATFFNVGDSRAYVIRGRGITRQSVDHTPQSGLATHARSHMLTQSLGGTPRRVPLDPHVIKTRLSGGDLVLLCSDGLTDMLSEEDIVDVLTRHPIHPARALTEAAVDAGGHDNVTVILIGRASLEG